MFPQDSLRHQQRKLAEVAANIKSLDTPPVYLSTSQRIHLNEENFAQYTSEIEDAEDDGHHVPPSPSVSIKASGRIIIKGSENLLFLSAAKCSNAIIDHGRRRRLDR